MFENLLALNTMWCRGATVINRLKHPFHAAYAGNHGLGRGGMRNSGREANSDYSTMLRRISLTGG